MAAHVMPTIPVLCLWGLDYWMLRVCSLWALEVTVLKFLILTHLQTWRHHLETDGEQLFFLMRNTVKVWLGWGRLSTIILGLLGLFCLFLSEIKKMGKYFSRRKNVMKPKLAHDIFFYPISELFMLLCVAWDKNAFTCKKQDLLGNKVFAPIFHLASWQFYQGVLYPVFFRSNLLSLWLGRYLESRYDLLICEG